MGLEAKHGEEDDSREKSIECDMVCAGNLYELCNEFRPNITRSMPPRSVELESIEGIGDCLYCKNINNSDANRDAK